MDFSKVNKISAISTNLLFHITYNTVCAMLLHTTNVKTKWRDCSSGDLQNQYSPFHFTSIHTYIPTYIHYIR